MLSDENRGGIDTKNQENINEVAIDFYRKLWKNRRASKDFSETKISGLIKKIEHKITEKSKKINSEALTMKELK